MTTISQQRMETITQQMGAAIRGTPGGNQGFFKNGDFPWVREVEGFWVAIREELDHVLQAIDLLPGFEEIQTEQRVVTTDGRWKIFPFHAYGHWIQTNTQRCPETARALHCIPGLRAALFSVLQAGKELDPHHGMYAGVLRYHLGLKVPKPETLCGIQVEGDTRHWREGQSLIFDDSLLHSAWNRSTEDRVVLFVDFTRPLPDELAIMNETVLRSLGDTEFIGNAVAEWEIWEGRNGARFDELLAHTASD